MGIQFIPWPRLTLHFMLNKRAGYAFRRLYSRQQLIIRTPSAVAKQAVIVLLLKNERVLAVDLRGEQRR